MSIQNTLVNAVTHKLVSKRTNEQMLNVMATSRMVTEYDKDGNRILNVTVPDHLTFSQFFVDKMRIETMHTIGKETGRGNQKIILMFHGGGYLGKITDMYTKFMIELCNIAPEYKIFSVEYTTSDIAPYPAAYEDALKAWDYLISKGYKSENIILLGDSAGGGLALVLGLLLRDTGKKFKAYVGLSPWVNMNCTSKSFTNEKLRKRDPLFGSNDVLDIMANKYVGDFDKNDYKVSPLYGSFEGFPACYITFGEYEVLSTDIQELADKMCEDAGHHKVIVNVYKKCGHDIHTGVVPETKKAWRDLGEFISLLG